MADLCILFPYHDRIPLDVLAQNWNRVLDLNRGVPVIPLIHDGSPILPGTVDVRQFPSYGWVTDDKWRSCDTIVWRWFLNRLVEAERYVVYEWDVFATCSVRRFYRPVWDAEVACFDPQVPGVDDHWHWFCDIPLLPPSARQSAYGLAPWACTMLSHGALLRMTSGPVFPDVQCELRAGTMARLAGLRVAPMPFARGKISYQEDLIQVSAAPGIYHPVKRLVDLPSPRPRPWR